MKPITVFNVNNDDRDNDAILQDWHLNIEKLVDEYEFDEAIANIFIERINLAYDLICENKLENNIKLDGDFPLGNEADASFVNSYFSIKETLLIMFKAHHLIYEGYYLSNNFDSQIRRGFLSELDGDYLAASKFYSEVPSAAVKIRGQLCKTRNDKLSAKLYNEAIALSRDFKTKEAFKKMLEAADHGHTGAQTRLGIMYAKGIGCEQNLDEALNVLRKAASAGDSDACNVIVELYDADIFDIEGLEAMHWCECAATDSQEAQSRIHQGFDLRPRIEILREKAIWSDDAKSMFSLYKHLISKDRKEALDWLLKSVELNYIPAINEYADMIVLRQPEMARKLYLKSQELGDTLACLALGNLELKNAVNNFYDEQESLDNIDEHLAQFNWYFKAAEGGYVPAMSYIARAYLEGYPVKKDIDEAFYWASRAADFGDYYSMYLIGYISENSDSHDILTAIIFYAQAAEKGVEKAIRRLYEIYQNGAYEIKPDKIKAAHYLNLLGIK